MNFMAIIIIINFMIIIVIIILIISILQGVFLEFLALNAFQKESNFFINLNRHLIL